MKFTICLFLIYSIILNISVAQSISIVQKEEYLPKNLSGRSIKGKVKNLTQVQYKILGEGGRVEEKEKSEKSTYYFDRNGNQTELFIYKTDESLDFKWIYKYNENGYLIEASKYNDSGTLETRKTFIYNERNYLIEMNRQDQKEKHKLQADFDPPTSKYKYDQKGNQIERSFFSGFGEKRSLGTYKYEYDINGNLIKESGSKFGDIWSEYHYKYDSKCQCIEQIESLDIGSISGKTKIETTKTTFKYDLRGFCIEATSRNLKGSLNWKITYRYEDFDSNRNYRKEISFINAKPQTIIEREIEYY